VDLSEYVRRYLASTLNVSQALSRQSFVSENSNRARDASSSNRNAELYGLFSPEVDAIDFKADSPMALTSLNLQPPRAAESAVWHTTMPVSKVPSIALEHASAACMFPATETAARCHCELHHCLAPLLTYSRTARARARVEACRTYGVALFVFID